MTPRGTPGRLARLLALPLALATAGCAPRDTSPAPAPAAGATAPVAPAAAPDRAPLARRTRPLAPGDALPDGVTEIAMPVAGKDETITLASARSSKGLLVVFTCNTCPYAKAWEKRLVSLGNDHVARGGRVVFINSADPAQQAEEALAAMAARVVERKHAFAYAADATGVVGRGFGATRTPEAFLFDGEGKLVYHGAVDDNAQDAENVTAHWLADALAALRAGRPIPVATTKALGCAIKFAS